MTHRKQLPFFISLCWSLLLLALSIYLGVRYGSVDLVSWDILWELRLPRVLIAAAVGMGMAVSGAALQSLFANPLCDPYTLGISSGASLGAVIGLYLGIEWTLVGLVIPAFLGAILFAIILYLISLRTGSRGNSTLLLVGVMLGFFGNSLVSLWISFAHAQGSSAYGLQNALVWLFGDLSRASPVGALITWTGIAIGVIGIASQWWALDALLMGEEDARAIGVNLETIQRRLIFLTSLIIGISVSAAGMIGFIGLVIPHFARQYYGSLHLRLIPICAVWGATFLTLSDLISRLILRPNELPVGIVTAFLGSPLLIWILIPKRIISS